MKNKSFNAQKPSANKPAIQKQASPKHKKPLQHKAKIAKPYFFGTHAVTAILEHRPTDIKTLFVQSYADNTPMHADIIDLATPYGISVQLIHKDNLTELVGSTQHQGIAVDAKSPQIFDDNELAVIAKKPSVFLLILDQVTDAHNLGACMRTASVMGVDAVIVPKNQSASITPTVAKVAVGATEMIPLISVTNLARAIDVIKKQGVFVFGTALDESAVAIGSCDLTGKVAIVMGSEGDGLRRLTAELCDRLVYIPMTDKTRPQSLNVSVATGVALYEAVRQRGIV